MQCMPMVIFWILNETRSTPPLIKQESHINTDMAFVFVTAKGFKPAAGRAGLMLLCQGLF